jgi:hypothetical protein
MMPRMPRPSASLLLPVLLSALPSVPARAEVLYECDSAYSHITVREEKGERCLNFGRNRNRVDVEGIQSCVRLANPDDAATLDTLRLFLKKSFALEQRYDELGIPHVEYGFERLNAELLIMLGDDAYTASFASGFAHPLALLVDRRGGLLVADWGRGAVYRIRALPPTAAAG